MRRRQARDRRAEWWPRSRRAVFVVVAVASALVSAAPAAAHRHRADQRHRGSAAPTVLVDTGQPGCDFLDDAVCLQPWPNDYFTSRDRSTATHRRLDLQLTSMPRNVEGKPIDPSDYNRNDGFSPGSPLVTKVPGLETRKAFHKTGAVPITDMARYADRGQPIVVIDAASGKRNPIWSELDANPTNQRDVNLIIRPSVNFKEGHRYVVALRRLKDESGRTIPPQEAFRVYRDRIPTDQPEVEARRRHMESLFRTLRKAGIERGDLYLAWDFTVGSGRSLTERELAIRDDAFAQLGDRNLSDLEVQGRPPAFTVDKVTDDPDGPDGQIARRVEGTVTVPCYLDLPSCPSGSRFVFAPGSTHGPPVLHPIAGNTTQARYTCQIPRVALSGPRSRAALYGHGLFGSRAEIGQAQLKAFGQEHDIVFCATDWIGMACADLPDVPPSPETIGDILGGRVPPPPDCDLPNTVTILHDLSNFPTLTDRVQQAFVNFMYVGRAMIHPQGFNSNPAFRVPTRHGATRGVFDTKRLFYDGNSQGGILGGALTAVEPDLDRATLGVPAMNFSTLLQRSSDFDTFAAVLYPSYPNELERPLILSLIQQLWDRSEPDGYAQHMTTDPLPDTPRHLVMLQLAFGDHQVANVAAETEARTIGARAIFPYLDPGRSPYRTTRPWGIRGIQSFPEHGSAIVMWDSGSPPPPTVNMPPRKGEDPHEHPRNTPAARRMKSAFLEIGGKVVDTCHHRPCYANGYKGRRGHR